MPYLNGSFVPDFSAYDPTAASNSLQVGPGTTSVGNILPLTLSGPQITGNGYFQPSSYAVANSTPSAVSPQALQSPGDLSAYSGQAQAGGGGAGGTQAQPDQGGGNLLANIATLGGTGLALWGGPKLVRAGYRSLRGRLAQQSGKGGPEVPTATAAETAQGTLPGIEGDMGANFAGQAAGEAGATGEAAAPGLLSRMVSALPGAGVELPTAASVGIGTAGPAVGYLGPKAVNAWAPGPQWAKDIFGNTLSGAGWGATGFLAGPEVGIPTTIGGAAWGCAKGVGESVLDLFGGGGGGDNKPKTDPADTIRGNLNAAASKFGQDGQSFVDQFNTYRNLKIINPNTKKAYTDDELGDLLGCKIINNYQTQQDQADQQAAMQERTTANANAIMAIQSQASQYFQPFANNILSSALAESDSLNKMADTLPPAYQSVFRNQAQQAISQGNRLSSSYMLQAAIQPSAMLAQADINAQQKYLNEQYQLAQVYAAMKNNNNTSGFNNVVPGGTGGTTTGTGTGTTPTQ